MSKPTFDDRLKKHFRQGMLHSELEDLMYPDADYPRYWKRASQGGPPGGRMSFHRALRLRRYRIDWDSPRRVYAPPARP